MSETIKPTKESLSTKEPKEPKEPIPKDIIAYIKEYSALNIEYFHGLRKSKNSSNQEYNETVDNAETKFKRINKVVSAFKVEKVDPSIKVNKIKVSVYETKINDYYNIDKELAKCLSLDSNSSHTRKSIENHFLDLLLPNGNVFNYESMKLTPINQNSPKSTIKSKVYILYDSKESKKFNKYSSILSDSGKWSKSNKNGEPIYFITFFNAIKHHLVKVTNDEMLELNATYNEKLLKFRETNDITVEEWVKIARKIKKPPKKKEAKEDEIDEEEEEEEEDN